MAPDELPDDLELDTLLESLDEEPPEVSVDTLIARGRARAGAARGRLKWAAGIVLAFGLAGVAYAAPGSPLARWLERTGGRGDEREGTATEQQPDSAGVALDVTRAAVIRFEGELGGYVHVVLTDDAEIVTRSASASTRFTSEPERLLIEHPSLDTLQIRIPRNAPRVEIQVGAEPLLVKEGSDVFTTGDADGLGGWLLPLGPAAR